MNREIRFRAKDKHGDWQYGHVALVNFYGDFHCWKMFNTDQGKEGIAVDPKTIGQSTGLHDKNDVEIFEGDIVASYYGAPIVTVIAPVLFEEGCFLVKTPSHNPKKCIFAEFISAMHETEVIGNIHDNPELLIEEK